MPKTRIELMSSKNVPAVVEVTIKHSDLTPEIKKVLEEKWYSEAEHKAELKKVFEKIDAFLRTRQVHKKWEYPIYTIRKFLKEIKSEMREEK